MIAVITSITGGVDHLRDNQCVDGASFLAWVDDKAYRTLKSPTWKIYNLVGEENALSSRRQSRVVKILPSTNGEVKYTNGWYHGVKIKYSIWVDGNMELLCPAQTLIDKYLARTDIATLRHNVYNCGYQHAEVMVRCRMHDYPLIKVQAKRYKDGRFPEFYPYPNCGVIIRRHTPQVAAFNELWWREYLAGSCRDQLSFAYSAWTMGMPVTYIPREDRVGIFKSYQHLKQNRGTT